MSEFSTIVYHVADQVARITLNRVDVRNAQDKAMLYELNEAFDLAAQDDDVKVIVLDANGPHFSSGHDLADQASMDNFQPVSNWGGFGKPGTEGYQAQEEEIYLGLCWRWRNLPKPTIAQVHGKVIAGGLMLIWVCDLIIASDDATFSDPVVAFGVNGVEYFAHPWEMGPRKAKELLFTGDKINAEEAKALGMVNHVWQRILCTTLPKLWQSASPAGQVWGCDWPSKASIRPWMHKGFGPRCRVLCLCNSWVMRITRLFMAGWWTQPALRSFEMMPSASSGREHWPWVSGLPTSKIRLTLFQKRLQAFLKVFAGKHAGEVDHQVVYGGVIGFL